ncbi:TRAP transporter large permease [Paralimibaculum aggregatum]|uniref:TRAP transporter large permease protein n=1 Tax=Paralimibaculum aggregatum TaxID=3036245 RepID=A0ABQ6LJ43_9RHOB|nr:TRAP transporter large permease [Limibaculum sp. NKW23]GMG83297.1 TRAP transporter large permease [Limibaculum sp. NKW23]
MSPQETGIAALGVLIALLALGCPVGLALILVGGGGFAIAIGTGPALSILERSIIDVASTHGFTLIPLFILMGALISRAGVARELFEAARRVSGGWPGGLAVAGLGASAAFASMSGSSLATASTMTRVAWPEMQAAGYDPRLGAGALAAGGTLGIMIPPSIALLLYALITEQSVGALFLAGLLPGLLGFALYAGAAALMARVWRGESLPLPPPAAGGAARILAPLALLALVMGGLYGGLFTPTEAGGAGAGLALLLALARGVRWDGIRAALAETIRMSATLFVILIGAEVFGYLLSVSRLSGALADAIAAGGLGPWETLAVILVAYLVLGCVLESLAMILLTVPVFYPIVVAAGFDPIWFGVVCVMVVETGLISPPVGMNLFVVRAAAPGISTRAAMLGALPFVAADLLRLACLMAVPGLALWLPRLLGP